MKNILTKISDFFDPQLISIIIRVSILLSLLVNVASCFALAILIVIAIHADIDIWTMQLSEFKLEIAIITMIVITDKFNTWSDNNIDKINKISKKHIEHQATIIQPSIITEPLGDTKLTNEALIEVARHWFNHDKIEEGALKKLFFKTKASPNKAITLTAAMYFPENVLTISFNKNRELTIKSSLRVETKNRYRFIEGYSYGEYQV
jgi:hypothetical protein